MKFTTKRWEHWKVKSIEAWINLMQEGDHPKLTVRQVRKWTKQLSKADFNLGQMWPMMEIITSDITRKVIYLIQWRK